MNRLTLIIVILSLVMMSLGGLSDMTGQRYVLSSQHFWADGIYLLLLAILIEISSF